MKKIINHVDTIVTEMCHGMVLANPDLIFDEENRIIRKKNLNPDKVTLISGGGSGHEPAHAGYVGKGMLDAAVCGDVFASPSQVQVYRAIQETCGKSGALLIIKNYSGDIMNFRNALYMAREDGYLVDYVKVDDDIAVRDSLYTVGRRGVAGTVFVHKIAGAAAERGFDLAKVKEIALKTVRNVRSIGFAVSACTVPAKGTPTFCLEEDEIEYGVGIHGEPGIRREKMVTADELAERMTGQLLKELGLQAGDKTAVLINGMGSTPLQELYIMNHAVRKYLAANKIQVYMVLVGNYMTSIDMSGCSVSILKLDEELQNLLSDPCETSGLTIHKVEPAVEYYDLNSDTPQVTGANHEVQVPRYVRINGTLSLSNMEDLVKRMSDCIIRNEVPFCELDSYAGDGDFGASIAKGFRKVFEKWESIIDSSSDIGSFLNSCALVIMQNCGGASGPLWGAAFRSAGMSAKGKTELTEQEFANLLDAACEGIRLTGERSFGRGAGVGDKTIMDALIPCRNSWMNRSTHNGERWKELFREGADAAVAGADSTKQIAARMGRAGTVGTRSIGYPDAGAHALGVIFSELADGIV